DQQRRRPAHVPGCHRGSISGRPRSPWLCDLSGDRRFSRLSHPDRVSDQHHGLRSRRLPLRGLPPPGRAHNRGRRFGTGGTGPDRRAGMTDVIDRIHTALDAALVALEPFDQGHIDSARKAGGDPVTEADVAVDTVLRETLPRPGEGWLSEETADNSDRLAASTVWIVDPLDGTREFVDGIPEWCVSIGYVVDGVPVAGGIASPARGIRI